MIDKLVVRFSKTPDYVKDQERLIRDLIQLVEDLNVRLVDAQGQMTTLKNRLDSASIP